MSKRRRKQREKQLRHAPQRKRVVAGVGLSVGTALGMTASAHAATFEVDTLADPAGAGACDPTPTIIDCSLRQAVDLSNASAGTTDTITFASGLTGTITLDATNLGQIPITDQVYIYGPGAGALAVSGYDLDNRTRIFEIQSGADPYVTITDLTLRDGLADYGGAISNENSGADLNLIGMTLADNDASGSGGAIYTNQELSVVGSTLSGNDAVDDGGAIGSEYGDVGLYESNLLDNHADIDADGVGAGGALHAYGSFTVLVESTVSGNTAADTGGVHSKYPAFEGQGGLFVIDSTIDGNAALDGSIGGLGTFFNYTYVLGSTVANNYAVDGPGGGIGGAYTLLGAVNSTISGNDAYGPAGYGGGAFLAPAIAQVAGTTVTGNSADEFGGGLGVPAIYSDIYNSIVSGNSAPVGPDLYGEFYTAFDLIGSTDGATVTEGVAGSNIIGANPLLGPLQNNGGPTETHKPAFDSPAVDKGSSAGPSYDQRGFDRPVDVPFIPNSTAMFANGADMGSVELSVAEATAPVSEAFRCSEVPATIVGTPAGETIVGTRGRDVIRARGGDDVIKGLGGKDLICGDDGDDRIRAGKRRDEAHGGFGEDRVRGGSGGDVLIGGDGSDRVFGQAGNDKMFGGTRGSTASGPSTGPPSTVNNRCSGGTGTDEAEGCEKVKGVP